MARLVVPDRYKSGIIGIFNLEEKHYVELLSALKETELTLNFRKFKIAIGSQVPEINLLDDILDALISLYNAVVAHDVPLETFVDDLCQAVEDMQDNQLNVTEENRVIFKKRVFSLLDISHSTDLLKAADVLTDQVNVYHEARILSDIRTVFAANIEDDPRGAVIFHNLKICYTKGVEFKEFYVAMDDNDIEALAEILNRATLKSNKLKSIIKDAKIKNIEIK